MAEGSVRAHDRIRYKNPDIGKDTVYGDKIARQMYAPGFLLPLVLKDVRLALAEAEKAGAPMPSVNVVRDRLITGIARGYGELDWTALGLIAAEEAGIHAVASVSAN